MTMNPEADAGWCSERHYSTVGDDMTDLVQRLRDRAYSGLPDPLLEEAANEMERLRESADRRGTIAVDRRREIERLRLTEPERLCIQAARDEYAAESDDEESAYIAAALDGVLKRHGNR